jgi:hypothetical protein
MGSDGCKHMANFLTIATSLTDLDISKTKLLDDFEPLSVKIASHPKLLSVNLSNNEIGEQGGNLLGATLAASTCTIRYFKHRSTISGMFTMIIIMIRINLNSNPSYVEIVETLIYRGIKFVNQVRSLSAVLYSRINPWST